jgi:hypothetical protein
MRELAPASKPPEYSERRHTVTPIFLISSALEVFLVLVASAMFLVMIIAAVAAVVWFVAGVFSATHETPTGAR